MDNFSQEDDEKELNNQNSAPENISDIQFEEVEPQPIQVETTEEKPEDSDIAFEEKIEDAGEAEPEIEAETQENEISDEELTQKLQEEFSNIKAEDSEQPVSADTESIQSPANTYQPDSNAKKYVIYIDSNNIDFIESLSLQERRYIINRILKEQDAVIKAQKIQAERVLFVKHAIVACITAILCFPILFIAVNKSLEVTITNYQRSKSNFVRLYKEQGKIKPTDNNVLDN